MGQLAYMSHKRWLDEAPNIAPNCGKKMKIAAAIEISICNSSG